MDGLAGPSGEHPALLPGVPGLTRPDGSVEHHVDNLRAKGAVSAIIRAMATTSLRTETAAPPNAVDRYFKITERGSSIGAEVRGGLVTFFTMSYIIVLNPIILGYVQDGTGKYLGGGDAPNLGMIAAATALIAGLLTILMG